MNAAFALARSQAEKCAPGRRFPEIRKSSVPYKEYRTVAAADYAAAHGLKADFCLYTPARSADVQAPAQNAVAVPRDGPWADTPTLWGLCEEWNVPLHLYAGGESFLRRERVRGSETRDVMTEDGGFHQGSGLQMKEWIAAPCSTRLAMRLDERPESGVSLARNDLMMTGERYLAWLT